MTQVCQGDGSLDTLVYMCQGDGSLDTFRQTEASDLSIWRKPERPASSRSKAVDSTAAHRFQTVRCNGDAKLVPLGPRIPGFHKPDRFYCYGSDCPMKFHRFYCNLKRKDGHA